jgi:hypothetical protein
MSSRPAGTIGASRLRALASSFWKIAAVPAETREPSSPSSTDRSSSADAQRAIDLGLDRFRQRGRRKAWAVSSRPVAPAIDHFERAIAIDPTYAQAYGDLAGAKWVPP